MDAETTERVLLALVAQRALEPGCKLADSREVAERVASGYYPAGLRQGDRHLRFHATLHKLAASSVRAVRLGVDGGSPDSRTLSLHDVTKTYRHARRPANHGITLEFEPGSLTALIGHNGAGKTTLLNQVIGVTKPSGGDIRYGGQSLVAHPDLARRASSMMPQIYAPLTGVTPNQAVSSIARLRGMTAKLARAAADELMDALDITAWSDSRGEKLSGGLRRLTSYAMAVVAPAPILLIDEPTNDVDPVRRPLIWRHLRRLTNDGHVVIVVTHNLLEVERIADRYVLLQEGRVLADSTPRRLAAEAGTTMLTISLRPGCLPTDLPSAISVRDDAEANQLRLTLSDGQVSTAVDWVRQLVAEEQAETYTLTPSSLGSLYDGITNAR